MCALALVVAFATTASAETQNVKVSGDISLYSVWRDNYDLDKDRFDDPADPDGTGEMGIEDAQNYFMSIAEVQVDADLTDNVATCIRMVNQRNWDDPESGGAHGAENDANYEVIIDLAYVTLKEMLYSPLTLTIGRQDIWFGRGFIVGAKQRDPEGSIAAEEYTAINSFDAIRATLDYDPWTVDLVYSKIEENSIQWAVPAGENDDVDLWGANVGYIFDSYNGEAEGYVWYLDDRSDLNDAANVNASNDIITLGLRGSFDPLEDATIAAEGAYQIGDYQYWDGTDQGVQRDREALAFDIMGEYRWPEWRWSPKIGLEYIFYSGEESDEDDATGDWHGWHPMFRGKFDTAIREFQNIYYLTAYRTDNVLGNYDINPDADSGATNQHQLIVRGQLIPTENLTVDAQWAHFWFDEEDHRANNENDEIGDEVDIVLTYDYTEDVQFGLLAAWFFPGDYFPGGQDDTATDIVGSMKVSF
jgi:hypothetical protein